MNYSLLNIKYFIIKIFCSINKSKGILNDKLKKPIFKIYIILTVLIIVSYSCNYKDSADSRLMPKNNYTPELEKVIKHYKHEGNKEKLEAARYLIENMKDKYSIQGDILSDYFGVYNKINDLYVSGILDYKILDSIAGELIDSIKAYNGPVSARELTRVYDISIINADSLIQSIDLAYEAWKTKPWSSHVNFEQFCEYILPYRIYNEPLQFWRSSLKNKYDIFTDSLQNPKDPKELVRKVNEYLYKEWKHLDNFNECPFIPGVRDIDKYHGGLCEHHYVLLTAVLRSLGVACAIDYTPQWRHWPDKHSWMVILDTTGKMIAFNPGNPAYYYTHKVPLGATGSATKVFRRTYNIEENNLPKSTKESIPSEFNTTGIRDVTTEYKFEQSEITLSITGIPKKLPVYLMAYGYGEMREFVAWSFPHKNKLQFGSLGIPAVYVPVIYKNNEWQDVTAPFMVNDTSGKISFIEPNLEILKNVKLYRKCPVGDSMNVYIDELLGAKVQVSNYADFRDAHDVFTINNHYNHATIEQLNITVPYRFIRLISSSSGNLNIAELEFYTHKTNDYRYRKSSTKLYGHGKVVKGKWNDVIDNDPGTSVSARESSWLAIDYNKNVYLDSFRILPRNNLNIIIKGEIYELLFFDNGEWHSLGRVIANTDYVEFGNVPSNSLLVLKNLSQGKEERIFTYDNGKQNFW